MSEEPDCGFRKLSKIELSVVVRHLRSAKGWTQETLAELAGVSSRTVQRLEDAKGAGDDTLRAIARAIEVDDLDFLIRPRDLLTEAGVRRREAAFERDHVRLNASHAATGRAIEAFMTDLNMLCCGDGDVEEGPVLKTAAMLFDHLRDHLDLKAELSHQDRLRFIADLDALLGPLRDAGWTPVVASRRVKLTNDHWADKTPWPVTIGYLNLVRRGAEPQHLAVRREIQLQ